MVTARRLGLVTGLSLLPATVSLADLVYQNDFESGQYGAGWSANAHLDLAPTFTNFMGRYSENTSTVLNNSVSLTVPRPSDDTGNPGSGSGSPSVIYSLVFDFYCIDAWTGGSTATGPDKFEVFVNGANLFSHTFSNTGDPQTYGSPTIGPAHLGFSAASLDSIYRDIRIDFAPGSATQFVFKWRSDGLPGVPSASWGVDNIRLSYVVTPTPGSTALLGLAGLAFARRRRPA